MFTIMLNVGIVLFALQLAIVTRFEFSIPSNYTRNIIKVSFLFLIVKLAVFHSLRLNSGLWRYTSLVDIKKTLYGNLLSSAILTFIFYGWRSSICINFSMSIIVIDFMFCFIAMSLVRVCVRLIREVIDNADDSPLIKTVVVGKLEDVDSLLHGVNGTKTGRKIVGIFCPGRNRGATVRGVPIKGNLFKVAEYVKTNKIKEVILIPPYSRKRFLNLLMARLEKMNYTCMLKIVPGVSHIATEKINFSDIREVEIDDLLGREPVKFDHSEVAAMVYGKNIMVTGGGGSIGSELCNQICSYRPRKLVIFEFSEFNLYEIERHLKLKFPDLEIVAVLGDVRFKSSLVAAIKSNSVEIIYHAAAYKHVPLLEKNIAMGFNTNVLGSANVAASAEECGVKRVVMISTDKAVRPTSMMGATKRIAERIMLERDQHETEFVVVRFGNVLGSRGSVIPLFKQQIAEGGPITVTSRNMIRYFMSIPEAVELVLQAGTIGKDRDIMILEMGEQVNIYEMAKRLIELSGFKPHRDIRIEFTGIRPGEKEYEELLAKEELVDRTPFNRICVARKQEVNGAKVCLDSITEILDSGDHSELKELCVSYIPENML